MWRAMIAQSPFMIMATINSDREDELRHLLASMNQAPGVADPHNALIPFYQFSQLHFARFTILEANTNDDILDYGIEPTPWAPALIFVGDVDGSAQLFLAELVIRASDGLRRIFSHCLDFDDEAGNLLGWLQQHNVKPKANYVNWRGRSVVQIREEQALAEAIRKRLPVKQSTTVSDPYALHRQLRIFVDGEVANLRLRLSREPPTPPGWFIRNLLHLVGVPLLLLLLTPILLIAAPVYFLWLRMLEESDPENIPRPEREHIAQLAEQEDVLVSNQFNVFGMVKPGRFRNYTIRFLLVLLDYATRHIYNRGYLTRIRSIHFARWVLLDDNKRVFFASNYDGSLDSYMDDFINKVGWGLNLVFSNGVGYPRSRWLIKGGAKFEGKYKRTLRRNQLPSETWYKAYPDLVAFEIAQNTRIRKGLEKRNPNSRELHEWLNLL
jgi:hypothetical protein